MQQTSEESRARAGLALRLLAAFLMTTMSAAIHAAAQDVPLGQLMAWRSGVALFPIVVYMMLRGELARGLRSEKPMLHLTRGLFGALTMALSFVSLTYLPVAHAMALAYLAPVLVLPIAALGLGEVITRPVWIAVALGFAGVLALSGEALMAEEAGIAAASLLGVAAGLGYALTMAVLRVHTKQMLQTESASGVAFWFAVISLGVGLCSLPFGWVALSSGSLGWLVLAGVLGGLGHIASNEAVARTEVSRLAPFDFTGLVWALGFDLLLFRTLPGLWGLAGAFMITAAALTVTLRR